ncbi:hypothetical protein CEXT_264131 [Caerostris extrusa]|uniref:Uncharacterized protein n=1 Tax=Caerostris extrusa TaxID=172846 RepID=A0AAV4PAG2_CAEEX|nr:hypothetical protein CEXT_264131 [Caerostris extrusa]
MIDKNAEQLISSSSPFRYGIHNSVINGHGQQLQSRLSCGGGYFFLSSIDPLDTQGAKHLYQAPELHEQVSRGRVEGV